MSTALHNTFEKNGIDLSRNLNNESFMSTTPSNSNTFFMPITKSTLSYISDTNVNISNLCTCMSTITGITNSTATHCPVPTQTLCVFKANSGNV